MTPTTPRTLRVAGVLSAFEDAAREFRAMLASCGVAGRTAGRAEIVFEEIVTNVMRHGGDGRATPQIDVQVARDADRLVLTFVDDGRAFDPLTRPDPGPPNTLANAPDGGLGIVLVRRTADAVGYERTRDGHNRMTVTLATDPPNRANPAS